MSNQIVKYPFRPEIVIEVDDVETDGLLRETLNGVLRNPWYSLTEDGPIEQSTSVDSIPKGAIVRTAFDARVAAVQAEIDSVQRRYDTIADAIEINEEQHAARLERAARFVRNGWNQEDATAEAGVNIKVHEATQAASRAALELWATEKPLAGVTLAETDKG